MVGEFLDYLKFERRYSLLTITSYHKDLEQFVVFCNKNISVNINELKPKQIRLWLLQLVEEKNKATTIKRKLSAIKSYYRFLQKRGLIQSNPAQQLSAPKIEERLPVFVEQNHLNNLFVDIEDSNISSQDFLILELLYATGMRRQELIDLRWKDVNFHEKQIVITGKGNKQRQVPVSNDTINKLRNLQEEQNATTPSVFIFCTKDGGKLYPNYVYRLVKLYLTPYTSVAKKSPHILRHSFATHLSNNGAPLNDIKELLGHASLASTQVYTHNTIEQLKEIYKIAHPKA